MKYRYAIEFETEQAIPAKVLADLKFALDVQLEALQEGGDPFSEPIRYTNAESSMTVVECAPTTPRS